MLQAGGGSGLGLWITNSIVNLHNGKVSVFSAGVGTGCSFTVNINMGRKTSIGERKIPAGRPSDGITIVDRSVSGQRELLNRWGSKGSFTGSNKNLLSSDKTLISKTSSTRSMALSSRKLLRNQSSKSNFALGESLQGNQSGLYIVL